MLHGRDLFSLESFAHSILWKKNGFAWDALRSLISYLDVFPHKIEIDIPENVYLENKESISIGKGTTIGPGVLIQGPCIIGKHCKIQHGAFLRPHVILGDHCLVGHGTEVKHSIFLDEAVAAHLCYVGDSILGKKVNLGAGVKCSNFRLDAKEIMIHHEEKKIETRLRKLGAIVGDLVHVGCNTVLNPGTVIGKESLIYPLLNIGGVIAANSKVKSTRDWTVESAAEKLLEKLLK